MPFRILDLRQDTNNPCMRLRPEGCSALLRSNCVNGGQQPGDALFIRYNDEAICFADVVARAARQGAVEGATALYAAIFDYRNCVCRPEAAFKVSLRLILPII